MHLIIKNKWIIIVPAILSLLSFIALKMFAPDSWGIVPLIIIALFIFLVSFIRILVGELMFKEYENNSSAVKRFFRKLAWIPPSFQRKID